MSSEEAMIEPVLTTGSTRKQMLRDTAVTIGTRGFQFASIFIKSVIIARALGPDGRGIYALIILAYDLLISYGRLGVGESIVYHVGRNSKEIEKYVGNIVMLALAVSITMLSLIAALYGLLTATIFQDVPLAPLAVMLAMLPLGLLMVYLGSILQSQRKLVIFNIIQASTSLTHLIAMFIVLYVLNGGVMGAVIATTFSVFIPFSMVLYRVSRITRIRPRWDWSVIKQIVTFGLKTHIQYVMSATVDKMDLLIMNLYLSPAAVGIYSVAMSLVGRTLNLPTAVSAALYPHMVASDTDEQMDIITESACRNLLALVSIIAVVGALVGQPFIVMVFTDAYREAYIPFLLLLGAMIPQGSYQILNRNFASRGKPLMGAIPTGIALTVNLVGDFVLIPRMGIVGAGIATLAGAVCLLIAGVTIYSRLSGRPWWNAVFLQPADLSVYRQLTSRLGQRLRIAMDRSPSA